MHCLLGLDLGVTTGYCILNQAGQCLETGIISFDSEAQFEACLTAIMLNWLVTNSVVEEPVIIRGKLGDTLQQIVAATRRVLMQQAEWVSPAQWKQTPFAKAKLPPLQSSTRRTQHERDAYRLAKWHLSTIQAGSS